MCTGVLDICHLLMRQCKLLSIDETGKASYNHLSELFILSGIIIPEDFKEKLEKRMRILKKKFFQDEDIVFHSRDIARRKGPFYILQDPKVEEAFWHQYIAIAEDDHISACFIITNKKHAQSKSWQPQTILKRSYLKILEVFVGQLDAGFHGKVIIESDPAQDLFLIEAHNRLQGTGTSGGNITSYQYRKLITSLSLVNKANHDADVQMADTLAPIAGLRYRVIHLKRTYAPTIVETMKLQLIEKKLTGSNNANAFEVLI